MLVPAYAHSTCKRFNLYITRWWQVNSCIDKSIWRYSGITTNEDSYNVWLKTLGFSTFSSGGLPQRYLRNGLILTVRRASFGAYPRGYSPEVVGYYRGRQDRVRVRVRTAIPLLAWHSLLGGYKEGCSHQLPVGALSRQALREVTPVGRCVPWVLHRKYETK